MEFEILDTINPKEIDRASYRLTEYNIREISLNARNVVHNLNGNEFIFLMGALSKYGTNFKNNINLIDLYLKNISSNELKLRLENLLYIIFLKKYETEESFRIFFEIISQNNLVKNKIKTYQTTSNSIWFFTHTPVFLAHTNAMFTMLESYENSNLEVNIASLSEETNYKKKCEDLGANFHNLKSNSLTDSYNTLIEKSKESMGLCWVGAPVNLDYVSKLTSKAIFWTHRFHLNFSQVKMQICFCCVKNQCA